MSINMDVFQTDEDVTEQAYLDLCEHTKQIVNDKCRIIEQQDHTISSLRHILEDERAKIMSLKSIVAILMLNY
jgi:hypothetical protein